MLGVTADTNIYISGLHFGGVPRQFPNLARAGAFRLDITKPIVHEVLRVLPDKFNDSPSQLLTVQRKIDTVTRHVTPTQSLDAIKSDPSDNRILECAVAAKSDFIVTGDSRHLLPIVSYQGIQIVTVAGFLSQLRLTQ